MKIVTKVFFIIVLMFTAFLNAEENWDGEFYNENSAIQYHWAKSFLDKVNYKLSGDILDIGCGDGKITYEIAKEHPNSKVIGIDLSPSMIETAKNKYSLPNLKFIVGDAQKMQFDNKFDNVISFSCFHWIEDHKAALESINNILKPKGRVCLFFVPKSEAPDRLDKSLAFVLQKERWKKILKVLTHNFNLVDTTNFKKMLVETSFNPLHVEEVKTHYVFKNKSHFKNWMKGWLPPIKILSSKHYEEFIDEVIEKYLSKHPLDKNGRFHYYDYMMEVVAEKPDQKK